MSPIEQIPDLDLYRELEVDPAASTATIDAAYRSLMKRHHPDLAGQLGVNRSKRLNLAHEWLTDPERRRRYDAARRQAGAARGSTTAGPVQGPGPRAAAADRPSPAGTTRTFGRPSTPRSPRPRGRKPARWATADASWILRLGVAGIGSLFAALILFGWRPLPFGASAPDASVLSAIAAQTPTTEWTPTGTFGPTPSRIPPPTSTPAPTPTLQPTPAPSPTPEATPTPDLSPAGRANLRLSGAYAERFVQTFAGESVCLSTLAPGASVPSFTGFYLESKASSPSSWTLSLDGLATTWSMDIFFPDSAVALWWDTSIGPGSVERTSTGFVVDALLTDGSRSERIQGTVSCD